MDLWTARFTNGEGVDLDLGTVGELDVRGRGGDWAAAPWEPDIDRDVAGIEGSVRGITMSGGRLVVPVMFNTVDNPDPDATIGDIVAAARHVLRPWLDDDVPNAGWLYYEAHDTVSTPQEYRRAVMPLPFGIDVTETDREVFYASELRFDCLTSYWEEEPATYPRTVIDPGGSWTTFDKSIAAGGDLPSPPTWEIDGPASGSTTSITILNVTNGKQINLSGFTLSANQCLVIETAYKQISAAIYSISGSGPPTIGSLVSSVYYLRSSDTEWWRLRTGTQTVRITKNNNATQAVRLSFRRRTIGV